MSRRPTRTSAGGRALIREHEGLRLAAYQDPVGVWTIGYGHTSAAGPPPVVAGLKISRAEADAILARDLALFERAVAEAVTVDLAQPQFDALVSFAFNVGAGNFRRSSVLRAVNERRWADVPRLLMMWNKAGGKVLPGLTRRRAAEGALFATAQPAAKLRLAERAPVDAPAESRVSLSEIATSAAGVAGLTSAGRQVVEDTTSLAAMAPWLVAAAVILLAATWVLYERRRLRRDEAL